MAEEMMIAIRFNSAVENIVCLICKTWFGKTLEFSFILILGVSKMSDLNLKIQNPQSAKSRLMLIKYSKKATTKSCHSPVF